MLDRNGQDLDPCPAESLAGLPRPGMALARALRCMLQVPTEAGSSYPRSLQQTLRS